MYCGLFHASRNAKFAWTGPVSDPEHWKIGAIAVLLGLLRSLPMLARGAVTFSEAATLAVAANAAGAWFATVFAFWQTQYFVLGAALALGLGVLLLAHLVAIALARLEEYAVVAFGRGPRRMIAGEWELYEGLSVHVC